MDEPNNSQPHSEKRKKRILTDARKTQNRLAQRAYRQRQKELARISSGNKQLPLRLHELRPRQPLDAGKRCGDERVCNETAPTAVHVSTQLESIDNTISHSEVITDSEQEQASSLQDLDPEPINSGTIPWRETHDAEINPSEIYQASLSTARFISDVDSAVARRPRPRPVPWFGTIGIPFADFGDPPLPIENARDPLAYETSIMMVDPGISQPAVPSYQDEDVQNTVPDERFMGIGTALTDTISYQDEQVYPTTSISFENIPMDGIIPLQPLTPQPPPTTCTTISTHHRNHHLPSPYINTLSTTQTSIIRAFITNARILCIPPSCLLTNLPLSPFYDPATRISSSHTNANTLLSASQECKYPPHLQPTLPQIIFPHHAYLDLLPFPRLRERGVGWARSAGTSTRGRNSTVTDGGERQEIGLFDPRELKMDIVMGGLVCGGEGAGTGYVSLGGGGGGGGQPWDRRSWRVAGWFGVKWRLLLC
ncbi:hypothetical protein BKA61DRAFT_733035 [Leptodontidium sp. MPI-SDFR-AT-0119]|nr:hypothetical protein BKA61DRAFT_733035 [Leptodontidium sp. MPI-SDFR-AT-0119]